MVKLILSCLSRRESSIKDDLEILLFEAESYKKDLEVPIPDIIRDVEKEYIEFLLKNYELVGAFPSIDLFCKNFPEAESKLRSSIADGVLNPSDLRNHIFLFINSRVNEYIARKMDHYNKTIKVKGLTKEVREEIEKLERLSNRNQAKDVEIEIDGYKNYQILKEKSTGMITGIKSIDIKIGGMRPGTVTTIAGFTSQYKSTFALNIAHLNSYNLGYNVVYITLETPKNDMYWNLLSCHSFASKFPKYNFISHDSIRNVKLKAEAEDYLFNTVEKDLKQYEVQNPDGSVERRGRIVFLDESDFNYFSFSEIQQVLEDVDDKIDGGIDAVIVDYIQLCKFSNSAVVNTEEVATVNAYVSFFRRLSQNFRKSYDDAGNEVVKQLTVILLSQIRRDSWRRAVNRNGIYDITCMSDSSELEKSSYLIMTTFTTEEMKERKTAQVQILKNRTGQTLQQDPAEVYADGEASVFCDEDGMDTNPYASGGADLEDAFSGMSESTLSSLM